MPATDPWALTGDADTRGLSAGPVRCVMTQPTTAAQETSRKPHGGFLFITALQLCLLWWAYRDHHIQLRDVRTWFGAWELQARRCLMPPGQRAHYTVDELGRLLGRQVGPVQVRASLRRLEAVGLLHWSNAEVTFPRAIDALTVSPSPRLTSMLEAIAMPHRRIPVPRRLVRFLAGARRRCLIATILGHLVRCLYYTHGTCTAKGCCKAAWIAEVFGGHVSTIKAARQSLIGLGWLLPLETSQRVKNRWGQWVQVNLAWDPHATPAVIPCEPSPQVPLSLPIAHEVSISPTRPPDAFSTIQTRPPCLKQRAEPLRVVQPQNPNPHGTAGVSPPIHTKAPTLYHIIPEDLQETGRLLDLFAQAQAQGSIGGSEADRLTFVATAEHARLVGSHNSCGLLAQLIRRRLWHFVTQDDEEAARTRLHAYLYQPLDISPRAPPPPLPMLSDDARVVAALRSQLCQQGTHGDAFLLLRLQGFAWTRERWDQACAALEAARASQAYGCTVVQALATAGVIPAIGV
jgi:hypothetical protein